MQTRRHKVTLVSSCFLNYLDRSYKIADIRITKSKFGFIYPLKAVIELFNCSLNRKCTYSHSHILSSSQEFIFFICLNIKVNYSAMKKYYPVIGSLLHFKQQFQEDSPEQENDKPSFSILENLLEGCQIIGFNWTIMYLNEAAERHSRRTKSELLGKNYQECWPGIEKTEIFRRIKLCMEERIPQLLENQFTFPDGSCGWFDLSIQPVPEGVFILSNDITEKKRIEYANNENAEKFRNVFETSNVGKSITKISGKIEVNQAFSKMLGYTIEELNDKHWKEITPEEDISITAMNMESLLKGEKDSVRFNKRFIHKSGQLIWTDINIAIHRDKPGVPLYYITTVIDITKQKAVEKDLLRSEHMLRLFVEHSPAAIAMFDKEMRYIIVSKRFLKDYDIAETNITGKSHYEIFPEIPEYWKEVHQKVLAGNVEVNEEDPFPRADGSIDWIRWEMHPWYENDSNVGGAILFSEVITDRILAQKAIQRSEDLFNKAFHGSPSPMIIARRSDSTYFEVNKSFLNLVERSREEIIGQKESELNLIDEKQRMLIVSTFLEKGSVNNLEVSTHLKSGKEIFVLVSIENVTLAGELCTITTLQDITERKLSEIHLKEKSDEIEAHNEEYQQLNEELMQTNQELLEAKERAEDSDRLKTAFLHNVSHEIRTPMNAITGFVNLLRNPDLPGEKQLKYLNIVEQSSSQLLSIITDIIDIASIESGQLKVFPAPVNVNSLLNLLFEQFNSVAERKGLTLKCKKNLPDEEANIVTDEAKLTQIISNLLNNALKFTREGYVNFGCNRKDKTLEFFVEDTGIGISAEMQAKVFNRFHQVETTKARQFGGFGLGLSISRGFVELLGGRIWMDSNPGKGSVFYFTIPYVVDKNNQHGKFPE